MVDKDDAIGSISSGKRRIDQFVAGAFGGTCSALATFPLDTIKVLFQVKGPQHLSRPALPVSNPNQGPQANSIKDMVSVIFREHGIRGLYRGLAPTLLALVPSHAIQFTCYEELKRFYARAFNVDHINDTTTRIHSLSTIPAAATAYTITNTLTAPLWLIKVRMQTQASDFRHRTMWSTARTVYTEEGIRGLYKGWLPGSFGVFSVAIHFTIFETLRAKFMAISGVTDKDKLNPLWIIAAGAVAGSTSSISLFPFDVVRSRIQAQVLSPSSHLNFKYTGMVDAFVKIFRNEGILAFYSGSSAAILRVAPSNAITWTVYELTKRALAQHRQSNDNENSISSNEPR